MDIKLLIAMHKPYALPEDEMYIPLHVGAEGKDRIKLTDCGKEVSPDEYILTDNLGDNISAKNPYYCELTGLYFAWKNLEYDALGLVHYRRHFSLKKSENTVENKIKSVLNKTEAEDLMAKADIVVPKKRNYYIESLYSHYAHTFDGSHLDEAAEVVRKLFPKYAKYIDPVYRSKKGCMFNMFLMKKEYVNDYCYFLFSILCELEDRIDISAMDSFDQRLFGRVSEILFNVWLEAKKDEGATVVEIPHIHTESINWIKKGSSFLAAKFLGKKYSKSF